jgi:fused signal recognition particle receptor
MGFLFWKKKETPSEVVVPEVEVIVPEVEAPKEKKKLFSKPKPKVEPTPKPEPVVEEIQDVSVEIISEPELETEKVEVVLPKRSFAKGIKSLFTRVKFDPENLDELEDVLIQADFGVDAAEGIVT